MFVEALGLLLMGASGDFLDVCLLSRGKRWRCVLREEGKAESIREVGRLRLRRIVSTMTGTFEDCLAEALQSYRHLHETSTQYDHLLKADQHVKRPHLTNET